MSHDPRAGRALVLAASLLVLDACALFRPGRLDPPQGARALGLEFGVDRAEARRALADARVAVSELPEDPDALLADRCPGAPVKARCRLLFGPRGLYAAQVEVPGSQAGALAQAVERGLGPPERIGDPRLAVDGAPLLVGGWDRPGWTVAVTREGTGPGARAVCRVEYDRAAPPVVAGVPLGRLREDVEHALDIQGSMLVARDETTSTYLGCPQSASDAVSCVVLFRDGRAAAVTEILPAAGDDADALDAWRLLARRFEKEIGRPPETQCPSDGPDRVGGDCTATWASDRLAVVVGAHRNAGSSHRGAISVYTSFTYPPLGATSGEGQASAEAP
jgi:hypothetical protein